MSRTHRLVHNRDESPRKNLEHIELHLVANKKLIRKDSMEGREYTVVPMVMMKEGVLNGSLGPLFYPADEISKLPVVWNGKPVLVYHPTVNGAGVSGCSPDIWTRQKIGVIMNTKYDETNKTLKAEAWIDEERCKKVDKRVWNAIEGEKTMELSTGLFTENEPVENGKHGDKQYSYIARNYKPDHLAVLPDQIGACSVKDGAGFIRNELWAQNKMVFNSVSFDDIRSQLSNLIRAKYQRKGVNGIENYCYPETVYDDYVVFSCDGKTMGQSYNVSKSGEVSLTGSAVEVRRKISYVDVSGKVVTGNSLSYSRKEKVAILINSGAFLRRDKEWLLEMDADKLNQLFASVTTTENAGFRLRLKGTGKGAGRDGDGDGVLDEKKGRQFSKKTGRLPFQGKSKQKHSVSVSYSHKGSTKNRTITAFGASDKSAMRRARHLYTKAGFKVHDVKYVGKK